MKTDTGSLLLVDDNEDNLHMLSMRLIKRGYNVTVADNGRKALDLIEAAKFDVVVLDIMMPGIDGFEVLTTIRKTASLADLPVIMATAKNESTDVIKALQLGANDYVTKPIDFPVLIARLQTQLALKQLSELKDQFLRIASHDLKNPLWSVLTATQLVEEAVPPGQPMTEQSYKMLRLVTRQAKEMQNIVTDFLDFQAMEDGQITLNLATLDLNDIVNDVVESNSDYAKNKGGTLTSELQENLPIVQADAARLGQVIQNLVSNAIKFSPKGAVTALVRTRSEAGNVFLEVSDNGPGLTEDDLKGVFTSYARLSNQPTGGEKSSGLGLAICKQMIELHNGKIGVRNNPEGGATFWFCLAAKEGKV